MAPSTTSLSKTPAARSGPVVARPDGARVVKVANKGAQIKDLAAIVNEATAKPHASRPPRRPRPQAALFTPKRKDPKAPISRPQRSMGTIDPTNTKATTTILMDGMEARRAEEKALEAERKLTGKKQTGEVYASDVKAAKKTANGGSVTKSRFYRDKDGDIKLRKG